MAHDGAMPKTPRFTIRFATSADSFQLERLAALDGAGSLKHPVLIGELDDACVAARSLRDGREVADPFTATSDVAALMRTRASQLNTTRPPWLRRPSAHGLQPASLIAGTCRVAGLPLRGAASLPAGATSLAGSASARRARNDLRRAWEVHNRARSRHSLVLLAAAAPGERRLRPADTDVVSAGDSPDVDPGNPARHGSRARVELMHGGRTSRPPRPIRSWSAPRPSPGAACGSSTTGSSPARASSASARRVGSTARGAASGVGSSEATVRRACRASPAAPSTATGAARSGRCSRARR